MKVTTEILEEHRAKLTLEFSDEDLERAKRKVAKAYARRMKIPGFRPGKAPYEIVARRVGEETLETEAIEDLLDEYYPQALEEAEITPYAAGKLQQIVSKTPPVFEVVVPLKPEVELEDYKSVRLPYEPPAVDEEEVLKAVDAYRQMFAVLEPVERPAEVGDVVYVNVEAREAGDEDGEPLFVEPNHPVLIGEKPEENEWPYSGFPEEFVGAQPGETKTLTYTYPDDAVDETLQGKTVVFQVEVVEIKSRSVPEIDDDFAAQLGVEDKETLLAQVRQQMETERRTAYDAEYLENVLQEILGRATIKYPPDMVEEEVENKLKEYQQEAERRGMSWEVYLAERGTDEKTFREELAAEARQAIEKRLVLEAIAEREGLEIEPQEVNEMVRSFLARLLAGMDKKEARRLSKDRQFIRDVFVAVASDNLLEQAERFLLSAAKGEGEDDQKGEEETPAEVDAPAEDEEAVEAAEETPALDEAQPVPDDVEPPAAASEAGNDDA